MRPENAKDQVRKKILVGSGPNRYQLNEGLEYWFSGCFNQFCKSQGGFLAANYGVLRP